MAGMAKTLNHCLKVALKLVPGKAVVNIKLGENVGRNGRNVVPEAETAKRRKTEETDTSRRIRWKHVKTGRKRWSECQKRGIGGRND